MQKKPVTAAGGVLFRRKNDTVYVLLIFRRGVWDLPKGKLEGEESIIECARREVSEEVGCPLPEVIDKLIETYHEYEQNGSLLGKTTHWYAMHTDMRDGFEPEEREGIVDVAWVQIEKAKARVGYENLRTVLSTLEEQQSHQK